MVLRRSRIRRSRSPCKYGRKKSARRGCKSRPGPKRRSRKMRSRRRSMKKTSRCRYGRKKSMRRGCKSRPGPKRRSRKQLRRRSMKKTSRCRYGRKKSMRRGCKSRPGPKRRSVRRSRRRRRSLRYNYRAADRLPFSFTYRMNAMLNQEGIPGFLENDAVEIESVRQVNNINYFRLRDEQGNVVSDENGNRKWFTNTPDSEMDYIEFEVIEDPNILYQLGN